MFLGSWKGQCVRECSGEVAMGAVLIDRANRQTRPSSKASQLVPDRDNTTLLATTSTPPPRRDELRARADRRFRLLFSNPVRYIGNWSALDMAAPGASTMRLTIQVLPLAEEDARGSHALRALEFFKGRKFALPVRWEDNFAQVWQKIEQRYVENYLDAQQATYVVAAVCFHKHDC